MTRLLLVEDSISAARTVRVFLARLGFDSDHVSSGDQAVDLARKHDYAAILMDLRLDGIDGLEAARRIRARERRIGLPRVPILGLGGPDAATQAAPCFAAGMDAYLAKPLSLDLLRETLERLLQAPLRLAA